MQFGMKPKLFAGLMVPLFFFIACWGKKPEISRSGPDTPKGADRNALPVRDSFIPGKIIPAVRCRQDPAQSYALYIPRSGEGKPLPVIYFFDPHGEGTLPLQLYQRLADKYGFVLIGSNTSRNGNTGSISEAIWLDLSGDTQQRLNISRQRIYVCGFSGGAKVAGYLALQHPEIKSVIAGGAGLPDGVAAADFAFGFTGIAGTGDMNLTDLVSLDQELDKTQTRHRLVIFQGKHEWAPAASMDLAFAGLQLDAMLDKDIPFDSAFIQHFVEDRKIAVKKDREDNHLLAADQLCRFSLHLLTGLTDQAEWFDKEETTLRQTSAFRQQWKESQTLLVREESMKAVFQQQFQQGDLHYWESAIQVLKDKAGSRSAEGAMYQRLLAYLSLAFYSISNQLIQNNQNEAARYFDQLYKLDDPANSEAWYFSAILDARNLQAQGVLEDLGRAVREGFTDSGRVAQQPEFQQLSPPPDFRRILKENKQTR